MLGGSRLGLARGGTPPILALVGLSLLPLTALADCPPASGCVSDAAVRQCDADQSALGEVRLQLRVAEQRLTVATGDSLVLARALEAQSALVVTLRRELRAARPWLAGGWWYLLGVGSAIAAGVVLALSL